MTRAKQNQRSRLHLKRWVQELCSSDQGDFANLWDILVRVPLDSLGPRMNFSIRVMRRRSWDYPSGAPSYAASLPQA
eukprot:5813501-Amphidinium_carterae.1